MCRDLVVVAACEGSTRPNSQRSQIALILHDTPCCCHVKLSERPSAFFGNSLPRRLNFTSALFITDTAFCSAVRRPANLQISDPHLRCERSSVHLISCWFLPVHRNFIRRHAAAVSLMQGLMSPSWPVRSVSHARGHKNPKTVLIAPPRPAPAADRTPASGPHAAANCVKRSTSRAPLIQTAKFSELSVRSRVSGSASPDVPQTRLPLDGGEMM